MSDERNWRDVLSDMIEQHERGYHVDIIEFVEARLREVEVERERELEQTRHNRDAMIVRLESKLAQAEQALDTRCRHLAETLTRAEQAEQRVVGLEATLREWLAQPHEVGDEQIRAALTPPPPAKEYLRTTLHGVKVKVLLDDEQK